MNTVTPIETLMYYDRVEVFTAQDPIGGSYIGMIVDEDNEVDTYLVTGVSPEQLRMFRSGALDLKTLLLEAKGGEWYLTRANNEWGEPLVLEHQTIPLTATDFLPDEGLVLDDVAIDDLALQQARERGNVVFEFSAEPPETARGHRIRLTTMTGLLNHLQTFLKFSYRKALNDLPPTVRRLIDTSDGHLLDVVVPAMPGSYRVVLEAAKQPDMFGSGELVRALEMLDVVFASADNPDVAEGSLSEYQGHLAGSYIRLLRFLSDHETGLRYGWADPEFSGGRHGGVSMVAAREIVETLSDITHLTTETVTLVGDFDRVNLPTGQWGLSTDEGRKVGKIREDGPSLSGLITGRRYCFECIEEIEIDATGREKHTLYLQDIEQM